MNRIRLLPVVVMAVAALLVLKTMGLVTNGGYVLGGVGIVQAASAPATGAEKEAGESSEAALPGEPTIKDTSPTLVDPNPTMASAAAKAGVHGEAASAENGHGETTDDAAPEGGEEHNEAKAGTNIFCREPDAVIDADGVVTLARPAEAAGEGHGAPAEEPAPATASFAQSVTECLETGDAVPMAIDGEGGATPMINSRGTALSEQQLLERLAERRTALEKYEQDLALRASIVDAAEKRIEERAATLQALEAQISTLVDQRTEMESGQFAGIVAMYETMKPKDAALIFNNLDMDVLLRVAKTMSPRKMAPILATMDPARAQELTVKMASLADKPAAEMTANDLAALPQIVGQ